jgi:hypothetical protein
VVVQTDKDFENIPIKVFLIDKDLQERIKVWAKGFAWTTVEGKKIPLKQMETKHLFNSMKMIYNHVALNYNRKVIGSFKFQPGKAKSIAKNPAPFIKTCLIFINELEHRNIPYFFRRDYKQILRQVFKTKLIEDVEKDIEHLKSLEKTRTKSFIKRIGNYLDSWTDHEYEDGFPVLPEDMLEEELF